MYPNQMYPKMVEKWLKKWLVVGVHARKQLFLVVLGLFFRKKRVVVVFRGSGCSGFSPDSADRPNPGNFQDLV